MPDQTTPAGKGAKRSDSLADQIAASRRELEELASKIDLGANLDFNDILPGCLGMLRQLRSTFVQIWLTVNSETAWKGEIRGPIAVENLSPLLQDTIVGMLKRLELVPLFRLGEGNSIRRLTDTEFPDGTVMLIHLKGDENQPMPMAQLFFTLIPTRRYIALVGGWLLGRVRDGKEWPKTCVIRPKVGPFRPDQWKTEEMAAFVREVSEDFHAEVREEIALRSK